MAHRIVGWKLEADEQCSCGKPATVILESEDGLSTAPHCNDCAPKGTSDEIAKILAKAVAATPAIED